MEGCQHKPKRPTVTTVSVLASQALLQLRLVKKTGNGPMLLSYLSLSVEEQVHMGRLVGAPD